MEEAPLGVERGPNSGGGRGLKGRPLDPLLPVCLGHVSHPEPISVKSTFLLQIFKDCDYVNCLPRPFMGVEHFISFKVILPLSKCLNIAIYDLASANVSNSFSHHFRPCFLCLSLIQLLSVP